MRGPSRSFAAAAALVAISLALRAWTAAEISEPSGDEPIHLGAAHAYTTGHSDPSAWWNPPLSYMLLEASTRLFGDRPWGWRIRNIVLGSLAPYLLALLGMSLFPERRRAGWIAGWLLALDPLHAFISRSTFEEIPAVFFFLLATLWVVRAVHGARTLLLGGLALGCSLATKHYFGVGALVLLGFALASRRDGEPAISRRHAVVCLTVVPATVYLACYLPWFARGYGLLELVQFHLDVLRMERTTTVEAFYNPLLSLAGTAGSWFVSPWMFGVVLQRGPDWTRFHVLAKNLPAWLAILPAATAVAVRFARRRERSDLLISALFAGTYGLLVLAGRPIFIYSAIAVLPLGLLLVGRVTDLAWDRHRGVMPVYLAFAFASAVYLYPLATNRRAPNLLYAPFTRVLRLVTPD